MQVKEFLTISKEDVIYEFLNILEFEDVFLLFMWGKTTRGRRCFAISDCARFVELLCRLIPIQDALPFGWPWYAQPKAISNAVD